jgi:hypothetical protein
VIISMSQPQLYASKKPCNKCGGLISWDVGLREQLGTRLPLNLDRTIHDSASCDKIKEEHPGLPRESIASQQQPQQHWPHSQPQQEERRNAIQKAHEENMDSSERLRQSIDNLAQVIDRFSIFFGEIVKAYLDKDKDQDSPK